MAAVQLSDAQTKLELILKDISDISTDQFLYMCQTISDFIYRELVKTDPERFITSTTVNILEGTNSYSLPADFMHVQSYGTGLYNPDDEGNATDRRWPLAEYGSFTKGYYISGSNLVLTPDSYPENDTATLRYIPNPPVYTALSEYFTLDGTAGGAEIIPIQYMNYAVNALNVQYSIIDEDPNTESFNDFRFVRSLNALLNNYQRTGPAYVVPDLSTPF